MTTHHPLPSSLPIPTDDGACAHLLHAPLPSSPLPCTSNRPTTLSTLPGLTVLFCYPRTATSTESVPESWNAIPGARGCTPQACSFRDTLPRLKELGVRQVYGLSTQSTRYQQEVKERLGLGYELLSDEGLGFVRAMGLPTFEWEGGEVVKRVTMAVEEGRVVRVWYPVFPPDESAREVVEWLEGEGRGGRR